MTKKETSKKVETKSTKVAKNETVEEVKTEVTKEEVVKSSETKVAKKQKKEKGTSIFTKIRNYFKSVNTEMTKVKWPTKKEMALYAWATLVFIVIFALFFTLNDVIISAVKQLVR